MVESIAHIELGGSCAGLALDRSGERLAVGLSRAPHVVVHAVPSGAALHEIAFEDEDEPGAEPDQMPDDPFVVGDLFFCADDALVVRLQTVFDNHGSAAISVRVRRLDARAGSFVACSAWDTLHDVDGEATGCISLGRSARGDRIVLSADQGFWAEGGLQQWIRVVDVATGEIVREWREGDAGLADILSPVALDDEGRLVAVVGSQEVAVLDVASGARVATHATGSVFGLASRVAFTAEGGIVVQGDAGLFEMGAAGPRRLASLALGTRCLWLEPSARAALWLEPRGDGGVEIVRTDLVSGAREVLAAPAVTPESAVAVSGDGRRLALGAAGSVRVFELNQRP